MNLKRCIFKFGDTVWAFFKGIADLSLMRHLQAFEASEQFQLSTSVMLQLQENTRAHGTSYELTFLY